MTHKNTKYSLFLYVFLCIATFSFAQQKEKKVDPRAGWHKQYTAEYKGINLIAALQYMKEQGIKPKKQVIVGVLDSGIDTTSVVLKHALWTNKKEKKDGKDTDHNGYIDDLHGWNFLGTADGSFNLLSAGTEEFREFKRLYPRYKDVDASEDTSNNEFAYYKKMRKKAGIDSYLRFYKFAMAKNQALHQLDSIVKKQFSQSTDTLHLSYAIQAVSAQESTKSLVNAILSDVLKAEENTKWTAFVAQQDSQLALMSQRINGIEHDTDKRLLMGDDLTNAKDMFYGNAILTTTDADHGTFVAGVIAGKPDLEHKNYEGVFTDAKLMVVRCVPDGDEYDKDVATAIKYAVNNGAEIINLSLGKYTSPNAKMVNDAIAYAAKKNVLVVQAAGNNHLNIDTIAYYPTGRDAHNKAFNNFIRVGASNMKGKLSALSNYGSTTVDLLAPGERIASVFMNDRYELSQGTSVATPIVSAVAALLKSCFPKLKAKQIKHILKATVNQDTDGVIDVLEAVKMAQKKQ